MKGTKQQRRSLDEDWMMIVENGRKEREGSGRAWATTSKGAKDGQEAVDKKMSEMERWKWAWVRAKIGEVPGGTAETRSRPRQ